MPEASVARAAGRRAVAARAHDQNAHIDLGNALTLAGRYDEAIAHFRAALTCPTTDRRSTTSVTHISARSARSKPRQAIVWRRRSLVAWTYRQRVVLTMRLFRQQRFAEWSGVVERVSVALEVWVRE